MAGYTIKNLREIEDSAQKFGLAPDMEAHFARDDLGAERTGISLQRLVPAARQPFGHRHENDEEIYVVVGGSGRINLEGQVEEIRQWDAVRIAPGTARALEAGPDGLEFLCFGMSTGGVKDVESLPGWWGD
jgi:quercetin dioxygenase-like cupin family protein